jgi:hypothetical protein
MRFHIPQERLLLPLLPASFPPAIIYFHTLPASGRFPCKRNTVAINAAPSGLLWLWSQLVWNASLPAPFPAPPYSLTSTLGLYRQAHSSLRGRKPIFDKNKYYIKTISTYAIRTSCNRTRLLDSYIREKCERNVGFQIKIIPEPLLSAYTLMSHLTLWLDHLCFLLYNLYNLFFIQTLPT